MTNVVKFYVTGDHILATQDKDDVNVAHFKPTRKTSGTSKAVTTDGIAEKTIKTKKSFTVRTVGNHLVME